MFRLNAARCFETKRSFTMKAMSRLFFAVSSLCVLCVDSTLESEFAGVAKLSMQSLLTAGSRHKRQDTQEKCSSTDWEFNRDVINAWCNPNDLNEPPLQHYINVHQECNWTNGTTQGSSCTRDENQRFCDLNQDASILLHAVTENCPRQIEYSRYQCTNSCMNAIQNLKSKLGCCVNDRNYSTNHFYWITNAALWSACGISSPGFCNSTISLITTGASHTCSNASFNEKLYAQFYCNTEGYKQIADVFVRHCGWSDFWSTLIMSCGINENNNFCGLLQYSSIPNVTSYPQAVESQCQLALTHRCNHSCQTALENFKAAVGCCVNYFNATISGDSFNNATNPDLWSACGIPVPMFCPNPLLSEITKQPMANQPNGSIVQSSPTWNPTLLSTNSGLTPLFPNITMLFILIALQVMSESMY